MGARAARRRRESIDAGIEEIMNDLHSDLNDDSMTEMESRPQPPIDARDDGDDIVYPSAIPFVLVHLACIAAIWTGITWESVALCAGLYWLRIFAIGAGYHRYFSHPAYATRPHVPRLLALATRHL